MSKIDLQNWLLHNPGFLRHYRELVIDSVARQFPGLRRPFFGKCHTYDWNYLFICASLLAQSEDGRCQDIALRIAQSCLERTDVDSTYKDAAAVVLDSLANHPAIRLAQQRALIQKNVPDRLPFPLLQDWIKRSIENSIIIDNSQTIMVNRFQQIFWQQAYKHDWISISAPTSAGKSFILSQWLADYLRYTTAGIIVYLVPTRALIHQVQEDIETLINENGIENVSIATLPIRSSLHSTEVHVLVLTQERFHILLGEHGSNVIVDLLIVDEAQKIGDSYRGVLLQQAIETMVHQNPRCRVIFASPMTENPDVLLADAPAGASRAPIHREDIMVNQNLIWVSQMRKDPVTWNFELILDGEPNSIGNIRLPSRPSPDSKRLPFVAFVLGNRVGGNIIYVNGAADAEKTAKQVFDLLGQKENLITDKDIQNLIELIQKTVHKRYSLAGVLLRGVAFHYGNMPLLIRIEIERLFRANKIKYLICTSTLIEGVNMPCQSIFIRGPTKGRGKPMTSSDFWNLAGRAGRWGKEFQGNIVCVDARRDNVWVNGAPTKKTGFKITRTADEVLSRAAELISFIESGTPRSAALSQPNLEYVFSYLMSCHILNGSIAQAAWARRFPIDMVQNISQAVQFAIENLSTPQGVVLRNPGISPIAMDDLLKYFEDRATEKGKPVEDLLPVLPESDDAVDEYTKILHRINKYLGGVFGFGKRVRQLALLIVDWMRGYPLARIISNRERYYGSKDVASLIRNAMKDVEEIARFQAPKYLSCYVDLLRVYLRRIGRQDLVEQLFELNVMLEFGVSQKTQLSLMGLGLSRSSAIVLSELITDDSLDEAGCLGWLKEQRWMTEDMPALIKQEIADLLNKK